MMHVCMYIYKHTILNIYNIYISKYVCVCMCVRVCVLLVANSSKMIRIVARGDETKMYWADMCMHVVN
jgi:hypothetical protein